MGEAEYAEWDSEWMSFPKRLVAPKPVQDPHPRVWVGGNGPTVEDRVLAFGDGWMPNVVDDDELLGRIAALRSRTGHDVPSSGRAEIEERMDKVQESWSQLVGAS